MKYIASWLNNSTKNAIGTTTHQLVDLKPLSRRRHHNSILKLHAIGTTTHQLVDLKPLSRRLHHTHGGF